jgi:hypothetical protein
MNIDMAQSGMAQAAQGYGRAAESLADPRAALAIEWRAGEHRAGGAFAALALAIARSQIQGLDLKSLVNCALSMPTQTDERWAWARGALELCKKWDEPAALEALGSMGLHGGVALSDGFDDQCMGALIEAMEAGLGVRRPSALKASSCAFARA